LGNRKKLRQQCSISARRELHSSPELHYQWTAVFSHKHSCRLPCANLGELRGDIRAFLFKSIAAKLAANVLHRFTME
jgi:hypothetical protein